MVWSALSAPSPNTLVLTLLLAQLQSAFPTTWGFAGGILPLCSAVFQIQSSNLMAL